MVVIPWRTDGDVTAVALGPNAVVSKRVDDMGFQREDKWAIAAIFRFPGGTTIIDFESW